MKYPYYATFDDGKCEIGMVGYRDPGMDIAPNAVFQLSDAQQLQLVATYRQALELLVEPTDAARALHRLLYGVDDGTFR